MKKIFAATAAIVLAGAAPLFAGDLSQIPGTDDLFLYGHPKFITSAASAAGGPVLAAGSYSFVMNPALTAGLQSVAADLGVSALLRNRDDEIKPGIAGRLGASFPTRFGVISAAFQGLSSETGGLEIGNTAVGRLGFSRDVTDNFYLGLSVSGGGFWYDDNKDLYAACDVGAWYRIPSVAFLKQVRFGLALQNLGKTFGTIGKVEDFEVRSYPAMITPKFGVAAHLVEVNNFVTGLSLDVGFPTFTNFLFNAGLQFQIMNIAFLSVGWDFNAREYIDEVHSMLPHIALGVKFSVNTSGNELFRRGGFDQTDIDIDLAWKNAHKDTQVVSFGAAASFGVRDTIPPDIKIGEIRYE